MLAQLQSTLTSFGISAQSLFILGAGLGGLFAILGLSGTFTARKPALRRLAEQSVTKRMSGVEAGLLLPTDVDPKGLMKSLIPVDRKERSQVQRSLAAAGVTGPHAVRNYYLVRLCLGFVLPGLVVGVIQLSRLGLISLPDQIALKIGSLSPMQVMSLLGIMVAVGFFGPAKWLNDKATARRDAIERSFPNVLDLLQISVESGLGLDAAMIRVANETAQSAPEISEELLIAQREIQAGRARERALIDMATRTGVSQVMSFANVVLQSLQYGSSISDALRVYSEEMRMERELRAQDMANKLPVKMSAVMASLMLPTLLMLSLGPVVIRYIRYMSS